LLEELREKSDSESFEDDDKRMEEVKKAAEYDALK